uniref:BZIP domain-containing protein n=1 Tax=Panagrolaimus sp. JU765 TaxID=591449 RepID=A0AC34Q5C0_9BILA
MESDAYFTPCYHYQQGMTYPHNQETCDHVPDIACPSDYVSESYQNVYYPQNHYEQLYNSYDCYNNYSRPEYNNLVDCGVGHRSDADEPIKKIYEEISKECEHFLLKESCNQCQKKPGNAKEPEEQVDNQIFLDDDITKLALSMKRKREQNKRAAAKYREKKKKSLNKALSEIEQLEERQNELLALIGSLTAEIAQCRRTLNLPVIN